MYGENHPPDDVRDMFLEVKERWRSRWAAWLSVSPVEWARSLRWGVAIAVGVTGFLVACSIWWLAGLTAWASLKNSLDGERHALDRANDAARQLPQLATRLREAEAQTLAWQRLLPIAGSPARDAVDASPEAFARASLPTSLAISPPTLRPTLAPISSTDADDDAHNAWRADLERLVARAGLVLEFARPGPSGPSGASEASETSESLEVERAEIRVRGLVANLLRWLAEIDGVPRHLAVDQLTMQGPRMAAGSAGSAKADADDRDRTDATLTVMVSAYRWRRPTELNGAMSAMDMVSAASWPVLPPPSAPWQTPAETVDVFRTPLTRRAAQDAVTMSPASPTAPEDDTTPVGSMRAGTRYVVLRRTASAGLTATWSDRGSSNGVVKDDGGSRSAGDLATDSDATTVDVTLHGAHAADALRAFARLTGRSVVIGEGVTRRLDVDVQGVTVAAAFDIMVRSAGLGVRTVNGVDWIAPRADLLADEQSQLEAAAKREALLPLSGRRFTLNYPRAQALKDIILGEKGSKAERLLSSRGSVIADPRTNQLFVTDLPERLDALASFIARIDVPVRQVLIEARIVEADDRFSESLGVRLAGAHGEAGTGGARRPTTSDAGDFGGDLHANGTDRNRGSGPPPESAVGVGLPAAALAGLTPPSLAITLFGRSASRFLQLELSALETSGRGRVVSRPRVVTADKVQALIEQGTELPYQIRSGRRNTASIQFRKATLRLEVTPLITPDGQVILDVDVRKDGVGQAVGEGFAVDTRHVRTQVQVEDGGTVAIGGIYQEVRRDNQAQVPWLGEVPVLGALFRNRANEDRRTELLVFLTPSVVPDEAPALDSQGSQGWQGWQDSRRSIAYDDSERRKSPDSTRFEPREWPDSTAGSVPSPRTEPRSDDLPREHPRLIGVFPEATRSARPTQIPVSSGIGTQISAIYAGKRNTCRTDGGGQDHGRTRSGATSRTAVL
ncbi:Type IV pilus biogenesis and competence protein PilQ [Pandoraea captiosa]|uniref:Type IV pilus biogenesis and competence protein PilQ n=1 Tax=Pandoraea captiosa TaxID=2508302 RepID=A0A5E5AJ36_9BURK|nr:type IV pilus secretin PilQ [Pandoraea captiosa]VVE72543.1 Type IV pilus biogenesis and competence protein PilQ [Pandoraea captiosa]